MTVAGVPGPAAGAELHRLVAELYPICRSITGNGVRETLRRLGRYAPLTVHEVASGTPVLDWTVPPEWNVRDAWIKNARGEKVVDFQASNLHLVGYSVPVHARLPLAELRPHRTRATASEFRASHAIEPIVPGTKRKRYV